VWSESNIKLPGKNVETFKRMNRTKFSINFNVEFPRAPTAPLLNAPNYQLLIINCNPFFSSQKNASVEITLALFTGSTLVVGDE
jgi:hypothetical protein